MKKTSKVPLLRLLGSSAVCALLIGSLLAPTSMPAAADESAAPKGTTTVTAESDGATGIPGIDGEDADDANDNPVVDNEGEENDAVWGFTLSRLTASPVPSGSEHKFRAQLSCSGVAAPTCSGGEIRVPLSEWFITSGISVAQHPNVVSWRIVNRVLVIKLIDDVPSGSTTTLDFSLTSANYTTPDDTLAEIEATVDGTNSSPVSALADVVLTAEGSVKITKFNPGLVADGAALPVDLPLRYTISVCAADAAALGRLALTDTVLTDTLPEGAEFVAVSVGGRFEAPNTVVWDLDTFSPPTNCSTNPFWVEVTYPGDAFGPGDTVKNQASLTGTFVGETEPVVHDSSVEHTFGEITTAASFCKAAAINHAGLNKPGCNSDEPVMTWIGSDRNAYSFSWNLNANNKSTIAGLLSVREAIPCSTSTQTNEFGKTDYSSPTSDEVCEQPAIEIHRVSDGLAKPLTAYFADGRIGYINTSGERKSFTNYRPQAGDVIAEIYVDQIPIAAAGWFSLDVFASLQAPIEPDDTATNFASFTFDFDDGSVLEDTQKARWRAFGGVIGQSIKSTTASSITFAGNLGYAESIDGNWYGGMVLADLLPEGLNSADLAPIVVKGSGVTPDAYRTEVIDNYADSGRTLIRVSVPSGQKLYGGYSSIFASYFQLQVEVKLRNGGSFPDLGAVSNVSKVWTNNGEAIDFCAASGGPVVPNSDDPLDWNGNGLITDDPSCRGGATMKTSLQPAPLIEAVKEVKGNQDDRYVGFPNVASADPSEPGTIDYRMRIVNHGTIAAKDIVLYDVFPAVGDTGVSEQQASVSRGSDWRPLLAGAVTVPEGWSVDYSTAENPCRPEVGDGAQNWPSGCDDSWSAALPADPASVTAIRLSHPGELSQGEGGEVTWSMSFPSPVPVQGEVAWNSLAFAAHRADDDEKLLTSEPPKVGVIVGETNLSVEKSASPTVAGLGEIIQYTVSVFHDTVVEVDKATGEVKYVDRVTGEPTKAVSGGVGVVVTDQLPAGLELVPGSVMTTSGVYDPETGEWAIGSVAVGSSHYLKMQAKVIDSGSITNLAEITENEVPDKDAPEGECDPLTNDTCAQVTIETGPADITFQKQVYDPLTRKWMDAPANEDGSFNPDNEHATVASGSPVQYRFLVQNTGKSAFTDVTVSDPAVGEFCTNLDPFTLAQGQSRTLSCTWQAGWGIGGHVNTATVTGVTGAGETLSRSDTAQVLVPVPELSVIKRTNGFESSSPEAADVPHLLEGDAVIWSYSIENTGEEPLRNVTLGDNVETDATFTCVFDDTQQVFTLGASGSVLPMGETVTCSTEGVAKPTVDTQAFPAGVYVNTARVTAQGTVSKAGTNDSAQSHYTADALAPSVSIVKHTNGETVPSAADAAFIAVGDPVTWSYVVTNTGNTPLADIAVRDDQEGAVSCPVSVLDPDETMTCEAAASDGAVSGAYQNHVTVTATAVDTTGDSLPGFTAITDDDQSFYFGAASSVTLSKFTQEIAVPEGSDGPLVAGSTPVKWTYVVTNDGNTTLENIAVSDDMEGDILCPTNTLVAGASLTCELTGSAESGQYRNTGSVTAEGPEKTVTDNDPSSYFGVTPLIDLQKRVNQNASSTKATPQLVFIEEPVVFDYTVTNVGNVALTKVNVVDIPEGEITCPAAVLAVGASMNCELTVVATEGDYSNTATATGTGPDTVDATGKTVSGVTPKATDEAHYRGVLPPAISLQKSTQGFDATDPEGDDVPYVALGEEVIWSYEVTNLGGVELVNIAVNDAVEGSAECVATTLAPGATTVCEIAGTAETLGLYSNTATVEARAVDLEAQIGERTRVTAEDVSHYIGVEALLELEKWVEPKFGVVAGQEVRYGFLVTNPSQVAVNKVAINDSLKGLGEITCTILAEDGDQPGLTVLNGEMSLQPGAEATCHALYTVTTADADAGQVINAATASGVTTVGPVESRVAEAILDVDRISATLEKRTNGKAVANIFDPNIPIITAGNEVVWSYVVRNDGSVALSDLRLEDDREGVIDCPLETLQPGEQMECEITGVAVVGVYSNTATLTARSHLDHALAPVTADSHYSGTFIPLALAVTGGQLTLFFLLGLLFIGLGIVFVKQRQTPRFVNDSVRIE